MKKIIFLWLILMLCSACGLAQSKLNTISIQPDNPEKSALISYLAALKSHNFDQAVLNYGGDYSELMTLIPEVKSAFKSKFFEIYCLKKKGACLNYVIKSEEQLSDKAYRFQVQFLYDDGSIFPASSCPCQAGKKKNIFNFRVNKIGNGFKVMDLPPREL